MADLVSTATYLNELGADPQVFQILTLVQEILLQLLQEWRQEPFGETKDHVVGVHQENGSRPLAQVALLALFILFHILTLVEIRLIGLLHVLQLTDIVINFLWPRYFLLLDIKFHQAHVDFMEFLFHVAKARYTFALVLGSTLDIILVHQRLIFLIL